MNIELLKGIFVTYIVLLTLSLDANPFVPNTSLKSLDLFRDGILLLEENKSIEFLLKKV